MINHNLNDRQERIMKDILRTINNKDVLPDNESFLMNSVDGQIKLNEYINMFAKSKVLVLTNYQEVLINNEKFENFDTHLTIFLVENKEKLIHELTQHVAGLFNGDIKFKIEEYVFPPTISFYDESGSTYHLLDYEAGTIVV